MELKYIVEICVAIDIAILGIAYPIIINEVNKIGEKYKSNYLLEIFNAEIPQRDIRLRKWMLKILPDYLHSISRFKFYLIITIFSFLFLILNRPPFFEMDFWLINNSANLLVLALTLVLIFNFILWLDKVALYNGKTKEILQLVIKKYDPTNPDSNFSKYCLKTINEFVYYSIRNQDSHIQVELLDFYYSQFDRERAYFSDSIDILESDGAETIERKKTIKKEGVIYSSELYDLVFTINLELSRTNNLFLKAIEHEAVSGWWLYGKGYEQIPISKRTYQAVWNILKLSIGSDKIIRQYWSKAHQYFEMGLGYVTPEFVHQSMEISNQEQIDFRNEERDNYLEFHYALGGLLMYKQEYNSLKYILSYSSSSPPNYVLLPQNMTQIFSWYEEFRNEFKYRLEQVEIYYSFPDLDNYGVSHQTTYWICQYLILLFIRQFTLRQIYSYQDHTGKPILPDTVIELRNWSDSISQFEKGYEKLIENDEIFEVMGYESFDLKKSQQIRDYIRALKEDILSKIQHVEETKPLSEDKISIFLKKTEEIINSTINKYNSIINDYDRNVIYDEMKLTIQGTRTLMDKAAFVEEEIPHMNYESIIAQSISHDQIERFFPMSFNSGATHKYLFSAELVNDALRVAMGKVKDAVLLGFNIEYEFKDVVSKEYPKTQFLFCSQYRFKNVLFVLSKSDLPIIIKREPQKEIITKYKLVGTSDGSLIYASVLNLGTGDNADVREEWLELENEESIKKKVQIMIWLLWLILWKKKRHIIQIGIDTRDEEQGFRNILGDIEPLE